MAANQMHQMMTWVLALLVALFLLQFTLSSGILPLVAGGSLVAAALTYLVRRDLGLAIFVGLGAAVVISILAFWIMLYA